MIALTALTGCSLQTRSAPAPIPTRASPMSATGRSATLVVWLPGRGDVLADFARNGIVATMREAGVQADAIVVDAHLGYYYKRTIVDRLRADVRGRHGSRAIAGSCWSACPSAGPGRC